MTFRKTGITDPLTASAPDSPSYRSRLPGASNVPEEISLRKVSEGI